MTDLPAITFKNPAILLAGDLDYDLYQAFRAQLDAAPPAGVIVVELSTLGGDPEVARMMGEDIRFRSEVEPGRRFVFLGKAAVYSAGATFMSSFAKANRFLTQGTRLMIHERKIEKSLCLSAPLSCNLATVQAALNELQQSIRIEAEGFENLIAGSSVTMEEVLKRAPSNWYIEATEAARLGLVPGVI